MSGPSTALPAVAPLRMLEAEGARVNVGCGEWLFAGWINLDADEGLPADVHVTVPPLPFPDDSLAEIYAGHFVEHLAPEDARLFCAEALRALRPGGRLGVVVPDTFEIMRRYVLRMPDQVEYPEGVWRPIADLETVNALFSYSTVQASAHKWSYDLPSLARLFAAAGFVGLREIDRYQDERIPVGAWYQCGLDGIKPPSTALHSAQDALR